MFRVRLYEVRAMKNKTHINNYNRLFSKFFYSMLHFKQICQEQLSLFNELKKVPSAISFIKLAPTLL